MALFVSFTLLLLLQIITVSSQRICYICNGVDSFTGNDCNFDNACFGEICYLSVFTNGTWTAGCASLSDSILGVSLTVGSCVSGAEGSACSCDSNFCNSPPNWSSEGLETVEPVDGGTLTCFECGTVIGQDVGMGEDTTNITCDGMRTCTGVACLTRKSVNPRSYCVSSWDGVHNIGCTKNVEEDELCVCTQSMCNYPYNPLDLISTTTASSTTEGPTPLPDGTIICPDGRHFGPNEQAVKIGEKLKSIILNNFGHFAGFEAVNNYHSGIDIHICNYKDK